MKRKLIQISALVLLLLVTGVFWGTWFTLTRSIEDFSVNEFIHIGKVIIANVATPMSIIMPLCIVMMGLSLWFYSRKRRSGLYFSIAALGLMILTLLITLTVLVPIDNEIKLWTASSAPTDWANIRNNWQIYHAIRTFTALGSFVCFGLSVLQYKGQRHRHHHSTNTRIIGAGHLAKAN